MRMLSSVLIVVALVVVVAVPAHAATLFTPSLQSDFAGAGHLCAVTNKSESTDLTVTIEVIAPFFGSLAICGPFIVPPQLAEACYVPHSGFLAYCKVTTSNTNISRANLMVLDWGFNATSSSEAE